jgi:aminoglycoside 3-N-acetyltransferase
MSDHRVTGAGLVEALRGAGVRAGDVVYAASSLAALGAMEHPVETVLAALREAVGRGGTIVMPAFNFSFCQGEPFDREKTPSNAGVLSEAFRTLPGALRSWAPPFHSVAALGPEADRLAGLESVTSFGPESVFQALVDMDARHVLIGCGFHEGVAHFHWLEERHQVPYRYWKKFEGDVVLDGVARRRAFFMYARRLETRVQADALGERFEAAGHVRHATAGLCRIRAFGLGDFAAFFDPVFKLDPCAMLVAGGGTAGPGSPVRGIDHIGVVSRYADSIRELLAALPCHLAFEGEVAELGVNCQYYNGLDVRIEIVDPAREHSAVDNYMQRYPNAPLHHIAFQVTSFDEALPYFEARGYRPLDGRFYLGPKPYQRVTFLSPVASGGLLVELVADDGRAYRAYGGER